MINVKRLIFDYIRRDEDGNIEDINRAIDDVSLNVKKGQFIVVLGHNGSGKSTFARNLNALLQPTEGSIWIDSKDSSVEENILDIRQNVGMVFQNPDNQIIAEIVEEDVGFGPENLGVPTEEIWTRVEESLKSVGMLKYAKYSPNKLSGGQKQRVAIAGTLAMKPKCIVLDEPTAMLDPQGRKEVIKSILKLNKEEKVTIILITHYMEEIVDADYVYVMNKGKVVLEGEPEKIYAQSDELKKYNLEIPQIARLGKKLKEAGIIKKYPIMTVDQLAKELINLS